MQLIHLDHDRRLYTVPATDFPGGVRDAFTRLEAISGNTVFRDIFGISQGGPGGIRYQAAAPEQYEGEGARRGCPLFILRRGRYYGQVIKDWQRHMDQFAAVFDILLQHPELDSSEGYCVEWYKGVDQVLCMVKLRDPS